MNTNVLDTLPCTEKLLGMAFSVKSAELERVCEVYGCTVPELKTELSKLLYESNMHMGACNQAIGFLIEAVARQDVDKNLRQAIRTSILQAAILYANVMGDNPVYTL